MFNRICAVCKKSMGNSLNRESYNLGERNGCHVDVHVKCVEEFNKNPSKFALQKDSEVKDGK